MTRALPTPSRAWSALSQIPGFDRDDLILERATGQGLNNELWRVSSGSQAWALRVGQSADALGQDRAHEALATESAAAAGVGPPVVHARAGVLLLDWVEGRTLSHSDFDADTVARMARLLRAAHVPAPSGLPTLADRIERMLARAASRGARVPDGLDRALRRIRASDTAAPVLTHHDVWPNNVMDDGDRLWLVDWEFAGAGDGMFDLATVAVAAGLESDGERVLLGEYGAPHDARRFAEARWSIGLFEGAWALAMHTFRGSTDSFDYAEHAAAQFAGLKNEPRS